MKNKTSPVKFLGAATATAAGALGTSLMGGALGGLFGGGGGQYTGRGRAGWTEGMDMGGASSATIGGQVAGATPVTDASTQFNPAAMQNMQGIFGNTNARQASLGASGMFALKKHLSPVNNGEELSAEEAARMHATQSVTDKAIYGQDYEGQHGTVITTSKSLNAYKSPNPPYDPNSGDDGAGGKTYETN